MLTSKRQIIVDDGAYAKLVAACSEAIKSGNTSKRAKARAALLSGYFRDVIKPGVKMVADEKLMDESKCPGKDKLMGEFAWYPNADYLRVVANVVDANFRVTGERDKPWDVSGIQIYVCPAGMDETCNQFFIIPDGPNGQVTAATEKNGKISEIKGTWKRTAKGYAVDVKIPWSSVKGYEKGWSLMPVEAVVNSHLSSDPSSQVMVAMNRRGQPWAFARTYAVLRAK